MNHSALLNEQRDLWITSGYEVSVERQNAFRLRGQTATLAGQPDLAVHGRGHATVIDVKTGREQSWHRVQVMIYMYALPRAFSQYRNIRLGGLDMGLGHCDTGMASNASG